jgi:N-acetylmuramoyl-L-alanine amidase
VVAARPIPDGFSKWALLPGTQLEITGVQGSQTRVRFDSQLETWVPTDDIVPLAEGTPGARRLAGGMRVLPTREYVDVIIPTGMRPAFLVEPDDQKLVLTLYDTRLSPEISPMIGNDPLVQQLAWDPVATDRTRLEVRLSQPVFGWLALWDDNRRAFVLRVRRVPPINASRPLAGLVLAVDAGHPPGGATGPTGLTEADAVLPVAQRLATMLRARGATVVMTRDTRETVALTDRPVITRRAGAHAFLSVHLNAFGDGTNPFTNHGTSTLFFHQMSEPLARFVQTELMKQIGQRDLGIHYQSLAIARPTWYPSILAEGLFLMFPDQEAAMRREDWQERYARAIADGAEKYFEALGKRVYGDRDQQ